MGYFLWSALFICLGLLVSVQGEGSRKKIFQWKGVTSRFPSRYFTQLYVKCLENCYWNPLLSRTGAFLPWPEQNGLLWGLHSPVLDAIWITAEITIWNFAICHPSSQGELCSLLIPMDMIPRKASRLETNYILISRASPVGLKSKAMASAHAPVALKNQKLEHTLHISNISPLKVKNLVAWHIFS